MRTAGYRWYDTRRPLDAAGDALPGLLEFAAHEVELRSTIFWDRRGVGRQVFSSAGWRTATTGAASLTYRLAAAAVRYRAGRWITRVDGKSLVLVSDPAREADSSLRGEPTWPAQCGAEFKASRKLRLFVQYERASEDNTPDASYDANGLMAGWSWTCEQRLTAPPPAPVRLGGHRGDASRRDRGAVGTATTGTDACSDHRA
jgi:hypothetical protein